MLLVRQLHCLNLNGARKLSSNVYQIANPIRLDGILQPVSRLNNATRITINNGTIISCTNINNFIGISHELIGIRHYYRNYKNHSSKKVRAYRKTRTWLTDHFIIVDRPFENIYSITFLITVAACGIWVMYLNLQLGGESCGYDVDKLSKYKPDVK